MSLLDTASLLLTPNAYKEGKLYSVIPSDGSGDMSVVRATTATRVNSAGLVELVPYNLLSWSEQFDNSYWLKDSGVTVNSNVANAPNGTLTADRINFSAAGNALYSVVDLTTTAKLSVYLKGEGANIGKQIYLEIAGTGSLSVTLTNEWNRFIIDANNANAIAIKRLSSGQADSVLAWGIQLVEGTNALPYQKTETRLNIPRLDYSNGTCPSLLVEPQRTNVMTYSEDIAQSFPTIVGGTTTANNTIAPSGILNADKYTVDTSTGLHALYRSFSATNGQSYTTSVFLKRGTGRYFLYRILTNVSAWRYGVTIDLETGTILSTNTLGSPTGTSSKIEDYGNGWYRVSLTINGVGGFIDTLLETSNTGTPVLDAFLDYSYTGNGTDSYYIWGLQLEAGSYATSYIPTTSASVTRNADVISKTGITSLIGQSEGTIFYEGSKIGLDTSEFYISDGTYNNFIKFQYYLEFDIIFVVTSVGGATQGFLTTSAFTVSDNLKIAIKYKTNDFALWINGTEVATDTSGTTFASNNLNRINLGQPDNNAAGVFKANIKALSLWKTALTNTQLAQLTTI